MNLLELQKKYVLSDLEVFTQDVLNYKVSFVANKLKQVESTQTSGTAIRLIKNKKIGFASSFGNDNIENITERAIKLSEYSQEAGFAFPFPTSVKNDNKNNLDDKLFVLQEITPVVEKKGNRVIELILSEADKLNLNPLVDISYELSSLKEILENSNGLCSEHFKKYDSFSVSIRDTRENDFIEIFTAVVGEDIPDELEYVREILDFYKLSIKKANVKDGNFPVLFTSKASQGLFDIPEAAMQGKNINQKSSPWVNKIGKQVLSNLISIKQDPSFGYMSRPMDDEGLPVSELTLIDNGILQNFYYDLSSAIKSSPKHNPTGNGFKPSLTSQPEPCLLNMIVKPGKRSLKEIIADIDYGLLVDQTMGGLTANLSGEMSLNIDVGFLIEKGEIVGRVKDTMISGNIYDVLSNVIELSNNSKWYWSNIYSPDVLVSGFTIASP